MLRVVFGLGLGLGGLAFAVTGAGAGGGWYLLAPRVTPSWFMVGLDERPPTPITIAYEAPLREWPMRGAYDSAAACEAARRAEARRFVQWVTAMPEDATARQKEWVMVALGAALLAQCIATDDPRLK